MDCRFAIIQPKQSNRVICNIVKSCISDLPCKIIDDEINIVS